MYSNYADDDNEDNDTVAYCGLFRCRRSCDDTNNTSRQRLRSSTSDHLLVPTVKRHLHVHDFCSRNGTQCVVARRAISVVRCVAWSGFCVLFAHCTRISSRTVHAMSEQSDRNWHAVERVVHAYFSLSLRTPRIAPTTSRMRKFVGGFRHFVHGPRLAAHYIKRRFHSSTCSG